MFENVFKTCSPPPPPPPPSPPPPIAGGQGPPNGRQKFPGAATHDQAKPKSPPPADRKRRENMGGGREKLTVRKVLGAMRVHCGRAPSGRQKSPGAAPTTKLSCGPRRPPPEKVEETVERAGRGEEANRSRGVGHVAGRLRAARRPKQLPAGPPHGQAKQRTPPPADRHSKENT